MVQKNYLPVIVFIVLCAIWGSTWLFIKIGLQDAPPILSAGMRFLVAAVLLYPYMKFKRLQFPKDRKILTVMIGTGLFAVSAAYGLVYWSEQHLSAGLAAVIFTTFPFFVIGFSHFMIADDRLTRTKILGAIIGFTGVAVIFWDSLRIDNPKILGGIIAVTLGAMCASFSNVIIKRNSKLLNPVVLTVVQMICGAVSLLMIGLLLENINDFKITYRSVGSLLYLATFGSCIGFVLYYWLISRIKVTVAALIVFIIPIVALFLDWIVLDQTLNWHVFAGSGLVIGGVGIASRG